MQELLERLSTRRNLLLIGAGLLALLLLCSGIWFFLLRGDDEQQVSTLYLVDASMRMDAPFAGGENTRMDVARNFVRDLVQRSPDENVLGLRVFGSGVDTNECQDTDLLVNIEPNTQGLINQELNNVSNVSANASLVAAALEAIRDLSENEYGGILRLIIITGGEDTCLINSSEIIAREAELNSISLDTIIISIDADGRSIDALESLVVNLGEENTSLVNANSEEGLETILEAIGEEVENPTFGTGGGGFGGVATTVSSLYTPTPTNTPTAVPTIPLPPTIVPTETPQPTVTFTPTPTNTPNPEETATPTPSETPTAIPSFTPSPSPTFTPSPTSTPIPASSPTPGVGTTPVPNQLSVADVTVNETAGTVTISVSRSGTDGSVSVNYSTADGTAVSGSDYTAASGTVSWDPGDSGVVSFSVPILNDDVAELDETFTIQLSGASNASIVDGTGIVTIVSDDTAEIFVNPETAEVYEGDGTAVFVVTLSAEPTADVTIPLTASNSQCSPVASSVTLTAGNWNTGVAVSVNIDDATFEAAVSSDCVVETGAAITSAALYGGVNGPDVTFTIYDDEALYIDQSCSDGDNNGLCDNGFVYSLIQTAVDAPVSQTLLYVVAGTHTETSVTVSRDVEIRGAGIGSTIIQGAGASQTAGDRVFAIPSGRTVSMNNFTLQNGYAPTTPGGAISNDGSLTISQLTLSGNSSGTTGGAIYNSGTLNMSASTISNNQDGVGGSDGFGGGLHNAGMATLSGLTVSGNTSNPEASGNGRGGGLYNASGSTMTLSSSTVDGNTARQFGGGLYSRGTINVSDSTISNNIVNASGASGAGGGFYNGDGSQLTMTNTTVSGNQANGSGGGFYEEATGVSAVSQTTFSNNQALNGGSGGGVFTAAGNSWRNVTISGNSASGNGGGLLVSGNNAPLQNVTIFNNNATGTGGGISGNTSPQNTIVAGNSAAGGSPDCDGLLVSFDYNLVQDTTGCLVAGDTGNNVTGVGADLAGLANNGGSTQTHLPNGSSPAVDAGNPAGVTADGSGGSCLSTDQRGTARPQGAQCDIGAVEQ